MARDNQSIGNKIPLTGGNQGGFQLTYSGRVNPGAGIVTNTGADWFGPLNPMTPIAPPDVKGRILDYPVGYNLNVQPRSYQAVTFPMLRAFADSFDLLRIIIETRKDQMAKMTWNIVPRDKSMRKRGAKVPPEMADRCTAIEEFFLMPDKENFWDDWLRMLLEDLFVIDAPTLYRRRTFGGEIYAYQALDGGLIKRVIDDWGNTPVAPVPAYQQILKGYPAVDYTTEELIYRPRVKRTNQIYGFSPVEQILMTINIGLRRQTWQLESFTEGNIPEALIGTPDTWTPDQVRQFQDWFDASLQGNTAERSRARFVPGGVAKGYVPTKPTELFGQAEEWLARVVCHAFSISPQPFVAQMNRATAETAQETAVSEGLAPIQSWVRSLMNSILITDFAAPDLEFVWEDGEELDPKVKSDIVNTEHSAGRLTYNEARREMGDDPYDHPDADRPMFKTAAGYVPIFLTKEEQDAKDAAAAAISGAVPPGDEEVDENGDPLDPGGEGLGGDDGGGEGKPPPPAEKLAKGVAETGTSPFPVAHVHGDACNVLAKAGKVTAPRATDKFPHPLRPLARKAEKKLSYAMYDALQRLKQSVVEQVKYGLHAGNVQKADDDDLYDGFDLDKFLDDLDLSALAMSADELDAAMAAVGSDSGRIALSQIGQRASSDELTNVVNQRALDYARDRAADLVSFDDDMDPLLAESTRDMIRAAIADGIEANLSTGEIGDILEENYAFSEERADTIAATEITSANSMGALASYEEAKAAGVNVKKSWLVLEDACDVCQENADAGAIDLDEDFPSGDPAPGAHPHCRCVLVPEVEDEDGNVTEGEAEEGDDVEQSAKVNDLAKANPRNRRGKFTADPGESFIPAGMETVPRVKAKVAHTITELVTDAELVDPEDDTEIAEGEAVQKLDNRDNMADYFPVDASKRGPIWAMGGNSDEAVAEREASLLMHVNFDQCVATQEFCDHDKVEIYVNDPTAKGFAPMAYQEGDTFYIQDGHHRAVASKLSGNGGITMNVKVLSSD